jgi:hypothetical protein
MPATALPDIGCEVVPLLGSITPETSVVEMLPIAVFVAVLVSNDELNVDVASVAIV